MDGAKLQTDIRTCSFCSGEFDIESEGGIEGEFGIMPMALCPTCYCCVMDMAEQLRHEDPCPHCDKFPSE